MTAAGDPVYAVASLRADGRRFVGITREPLGVGRSATHLNTPRTTAEREVLVQGLASEGGQ